MRRPIQVTTIGDMLAATAQRSPDRIAVSFPGLDVTAAELLASAHRRARSLRALGVERGDRVGIVAPNCIEYLEVLFGASLLGAVVVAVNARYRAAELGYVAADAELSVLVTSDVLAEQIDFVPLLHEALPGLATATDPLRLGLPATPRLRACVMLGGSSPAGFLDAAAFDALAEHVAGGEIDTAAAGVMVRDVGIMMYTSGTTAQPKGCPLSHEAVIRTGAAMVERYSLGATDVWWDPLPMFHMSSTLPMTAALLADSGFMTMVDFDVDSAVRQIVDGRATFLFGTFPTINQELLAHPDFVAANLGSVRYVNQIGPPVAQRQLQDALPAAVQVAAYGCTELGGIVSMSDPAESAELRATRCGPAWSGVEIRIVDPETGHDVPTGEHGEIVGRGFGLFEGYHRDPVKNAEAIDANGYFHTGDIGSLDEHGNIAYHGRTKDMFKVGGENVAALEVEAYLAAHPAVRLVQVVGVPDARLVEVVAAFVEVEPGRAVSEEELVAFCRGQIASFKIPRYIRFVDSWPQSATKIQKFKLREQLLAELGDAVPASE